MKIISHLTTWTAIALLAGCGVFQAGPETEECAVTEAPQCPVCPDLAPELPRCPQPDVVEKVVTVTLPEKQAPGPATAGAMQLPIIGAVEWVQVEPGDLRMEARIDTGAETTSIHAEDIQLVEKDGKRYVHFNLLDPANGEKRPIEERLRRTVKIKMGEDEHDRRYVVKLWITLGEAHSLVDVTLTDRESMEYPLLIGRNFLVDAAIVDVSRQHLTSR